MAKYNFIVNNQQYHLFQHLVRFYLCFSSFHLDDFDADDNQDCIDAWKFSGKIDMKQDFGHNESFQNGDENLF